MGRQWNPEMRALAKHYATLTPAEVATAERDRILSVVANTQPDQLHRALAIILDWRDRGRPFSANDVRADMDAALIKTAVRGAAFAMAKRRHLIVSVGFTASTDKGTHAKRIETYADPFADARRGPVSAHPARGEVDDAAATPLSPPPPPADDPGPVPPGVVAQASCERAPRQRRVPRRPVEEITVPVHRDRTGQFSTSSDVAAGQGDLFADLEQLQGATS